MASNSHVSFFLLACRQAPSWRWLRPLFFFCGSPVAIRYLRALHATMDCLSTAHKPFPGGLAWLIIVPGAGYAWILFFQIACRGAFGLNVGPPGSPPLRPRACLNRLAWWSASRCSWRRAFKLRPLSHAWLFGLFSGLSRVVFARNCWRSRSPKRFARGPGSSAPIHGQRP